MDLNLHSDKPIFLQIAEGIEDGILSGAFLETEQIPSITEFSVRYNINPATANKGINLLVDQEIIYKKRGVGMFVAEGAVEKLKSNRKERFYQDYVVELVDEARRLEITRQEAQDMVVRGFDE